MLWLHYFGLILKHCSDTELPWQQVIDTYLPGARKDDVIDPLLGKWDTSRLVSTHCVADWTIYHSSNSYVSTDFYFVEEARESQIVPEHMGLHKDSRDTLLSLLQERGYQQSLKPRGNGR